MINHPETYGNALTETVRFSPRKSFSTNPKVVFLILLICLIVDAVNFFMLFRLELPDSYIMIGLLCAGCLMAYDAAPYILAIQFSRRNVGLKTNIPLMIFCFALIGICIVINFVLRIQTKDDLIPSETVMLSGEIVEKSNPIALTVAVMLALVSVITSFISFYLSYSVNSPKILAEELRACETHKKALDTEITKLKMVLSELELESPEEFVKRMDAEDYRKYKAAQFLVIQNVLCANDSFKHKLMEYLGNPEDYNYIASADNQKLLEMIREIAGDVGLNSINELDQLCDTNPENAFKKLSHKEAN